MRITSYKDLKKIISLIGELKLIILEGKGGISKSYSVLEALKNKDYLLIKSHITPAKFYQELFQYAEKRDFKKLLIVIDDLDEFEKNNKMISLIKAFTDTLETNQGHYHSTSYILEGFPSYFSFQELSMVIICNSFKELTKNIKAVSDRAFYINFTPSNKEIFNKIKQFGKDKEIIDFLEKFYLYSKNFSLRTYVKSEMLKRVSKKLDINWKKLMIKEMNIDNIIYTLNLEIKNSDKVKEISNIKKCSIRTAQRIIRQSDT